MAWAVAWGTVFNFRVNNYSFFRLLDDLYIFEDIRQLIRMISGSRLSVSVLNPVRGHVQWVHAAM